MSNNPDTLEQQLAAEIEEVTDDISDFRWFDVPILIIFWVLFGIVALQFFTRYVLNDSLGWTEEIARYFLIFLGFVGSVGCVRKGKHIFLEFFYRYLPDSFIKPIALLVELIVAGFFGYTAYLCVELAQRTSQNMVSVPLPKSLIYYTVILACAFMAFFAVLNFIRMAKTSADAVYAEKLGANSESI